MGKIVRKESTFTLISVFGDTDWQTALEEFKFLLSLLNA